MKTIIRFVACLAFFYSGDVYAQTNVETQTNRTAAEEGEPIMFQFEPNYETATMLQRAALLEKIKALDTLPISERKRFRMIKQLYKESRSIKFEKSVLVTTDFAEDEFEN